ncbi:hypothetical protein LCGC14_2850490, partial [marine sediment metagenome]
AGQADVLYHNRGDGTFEDVTEGMGILRPEGRAMGVSAADYDDDGYVDIYVANDAMENFLFHNEKGQRFQELALPAGVAYNHAGDATSSMAVDFADYDGDGLMDLFVSDMSYSALYRNEGYGLFRDVTYMAGIAVASGQYVGWASAFIDYDNDGDLDVYVNNYGPNVLYRNNGNGTFTDVTEKAGVAAGHQVGAGTNFLDIDKDGDLDLFVANYVKFFFDDDRVFKHFTGRPVYPGPNDYSPTPDILYRNNGDGTFTDISEESGIGAQAGTGMGTVCADYDNDGDTDIIVANDMLGNFLYENDGTGKFEEAALFAGIAYDLGGSPQGSMGVVCADYDNDGWLDVHMTSYQRQLTTLYRNLGDGFLEDATRLSGAGAGTVPEVTWGNGLVDFDNDGDRD